MNLRKGLIKHLNLIADLLEFNSANKFKVNAFRNGANILRRLGPDIEIKIKNGTIRDIKGIGKGLQTVIYEFYHSGNSTELSELLEKTPHGILELLNIRGLGTSKIKLLNKELNISNIKGLEQACSNNSIASLKGFGEKTQEKILTEIKRIKENRSKVLLSEALEIANEIKSSFNNFDSVLKIKISGDLRRRVEIISKLEFVLLVKSYADFENEIKDNRLYAKELDHDTSSKILKLQTEYKPKILLYLTTNENEFETILFKSTGSEEFIQHLGADKSNYSNSPESKVFEEQGIPYVIPEMREKEYYRAPDKFRGNSNLEINQFKGLLHFHTDWSDGINTLSEMIDAAISRGFLYAAVCDHSKSAFYANGLNEERVLKQKEEIDKLNKVKNIKIYQGIESDILRDGKLDYDNDFLDNFDFIVASVHSQFNLTEEEMTKRVIRAIENPHTNLIGHPTGRLLLRRDPYSINLNKVIDACTQNNVAIEINANPNRLDLDWRMIYYAREKGCKFAINPDAHSVDGIDDIKYGIMIARKGGIQKDEVINTYEINEFENFLNKN
ncbi:DNA polymerase/3'-5' exonuclease PolX [bacterium BMS3Abin04]|nr:DNA polymerase/3'-5' exonuclease PolX [bacterium BMS3Abin04]